MFIEIPRCGLGYSRKGRLNWGAQRMLTFFGIYVSDSCRISAREDAKRSRTTKAQPMKQMRAEVNEGRTWGAVPDQFWCH